MGDRTVGFVRLCDGRRLAFRELGCTDGSAKRSLVALHGLMSSRLGGMPGIEIRVFRCAFDTICLCTNWRGKEFQKAEGEMIRREWRGASSFCTIFKRLRCAGVREEVLVEFGVRFIAIDRPGYGQSDPHPCQTFRSTCKDIEAVADNLRLGNRIWLHGYSMGGAFCWAAARYIPDRIEGIAMWCPVGNLWWKDISKDEQKIMLSTYSTMDRILFSLCKLSPFVFIKWYSRILCSHLTNPSVDLTAGLSPADKKCIQQPGMAELRVRDRMESITRSKGYGVARDFELMNKGWDFQLAEVGERFKRKIHIWHGEEDTLVPLALQKWAQKQLPNLVRLEVLPGEGHISLFANSNLDRLTLNTLFGTGSGDSKERYKSAGR